ncbi:hypothetical protein BJ684DRAFT_15330 [Piptocephalis cylindrospora]|uniref:Uncharacterized protein n=1 Tax=Piptocephalis cylindrospora TaxID=1907219 RepID=A0A4P9Y7S6_9FUNG|nr:hypothetical protein BJ684DRAFT_15330 [Piptocephalis cylindrospora]|eukprot:RKP14331.1 hypothetical protein BJ684DRAFT_15330 [Piptocephalis cylindrospora]
MSLVDLDITSYGDAFHLRGTQSSIRIAHALSERVGSSLRGLGHQVIARAQLHPQTRLAILLLGVGSCLAGAGILCFGIAATVKGISPGRGSRYLLGRGTQYPFPPSMPSSIPSTKEGFLQRWPDLRCIG